MQPTPFHAYYMARTLENLSDEDRLVSVYASSAIQVYPFQIAAANFSMRSPYHKGAVLCDEAGMGKSHEAMLVMTQTWLEGHHRILLAIPNADLLAQWTDLIDRLYTLPYIVLASQEQWNAHCSSDNPNAFVQDAVVITTYDFAADQETAACEVDWDLTVFEEANVLSSGYQEESKQAKALKRIAGSSFKLLLTGTPIEKNILDLYGLLWFIDETILPDKTEFLARYLRQPENYPELAQRVSPYCFRTLRSQAAQYAKLPRRIPVTLEYTPGAKEQELYALLYTYIHKPHKYAFPEMNAYDLALRLLGLLSSSAAAILQTIRGVIRRLESIPPAAEELADWRHMESVAASVECDAKAALLLRVLKQVFPLLRKCGAKKKIVIFTESLATQKVLLRLLKDTYACDVYNGSADYAAIQHFKTSGEILVSTDHGARGFNMEESSCVIHYDLLFNTLKMEQRIDRCHRLEQQNDVLTIAFIDKNNFADVRKLELVNKRLLVSDGVFGVSDTVIGGFTENLSQAMETLAARARTKEQVEMHYQQTLAANEAENRQLVSSAEDMLFTTFTRELCNKVKVTPHYVEERAKQLNAQLWAVAKFYFENYTRTHDDCVYEIDEAAQTVTATQYESLPHLFYYWVGRRSRRYTSQKRYGMTADFKPRHGRITLASVVGRGILQELACADSGTLTVDAPIEPCTVALYSIQFTPSGRERPLLVGKTASGRQLSQEECRAILDMEVVQFAENGERTPHWLRRSSRYHELDRYVPLDALAQEENAALRPEKAEEIDRMKLKAKASKHAIGRAVGDLERQVQAAQRELQAATGDRLKILTLNRKLSQLQRAWKQKQETQFFEEMQIDVELEKQIETFLQQQKVTANAVRQFVIDVEGQK